MGLNSGRVKKVSGYAKRIFFNDNIEYRDFSDDLVGVQLTSEGGTPLFTMGNFSVTTNLEPTPSKTFNRGTFSDYFCLDDITSEDTTFLTIEGNLKTQLNLDITNPLHYVWYGNFNEFLRVSLNDISENWSSAIYVDNKVGSVSGDNVTNYVYDPITDTSTFTIATKYFVNPYVIKYTTDAAFVNDSEELNTLRNLTTNYTSYVVDVDGNEFNIKEFTASTTTTNDTLTVNVEGESFPDVTGTSTSTAHFIKPNEQQRENFFSGLNDFQRNILNRLTNPIYTIDIYFPEESDSGSILYTNRQLTFPVLDDGYNLNFFDGLYTAYLEDLTEIIDNFDENQTNLMIRKYTAEIINSFDSTPRCDADDLTNNGQKATNLLNIYGREFDEVKKYMNGIKYAHVVTYDKKDNVPDSLVKDLAFMLGFEKINFLGDVDLTKNLLPSKGYEAFSGVSRNLTLREVDIELYRRIILNIAWLWKSKGARKAIEFLFRFIGAPESIVEFDEHVYVADSPLDVEQVKRMLYLYTGDVDISKLPFDENGYPLPPVNGDLVTQEIFVGTGQTQTRTTQVTDMYYQKAGGWYRNTGGENADIDTNVGNNPHVGPYDGGTEYIDYFSSNCFIPDYTPTSTVFSSHTRLYENLFVNYNYGIINGMPATFDVYASPLTLGNQLLSTCVTLTASIDSNCPTLSGGTGPSTLLEELCTQAREEYNEWLEKIKEEPYLRYSPEWEIVKRNNEVASKNYFDGVNAAACNDNSCIELCVDVFDGIDSNPCDDWVLVDNDDSAPFIYFTDEDNNKVLFDDFPLCCVVNGGSYRNFVFDNGKEACYCARSAPCNGLIPFTTRVDGIVVWEQTDGDSNVVAKTTSEVNNLTIESTAECCAWYGYGISIQSDGKISCLDNSDTATNSSTATNSTTTEGTLATYEQQYLDTLATQGAESPETQESKLAYDTNLKLNDEFQSSTINQTEVSYDTSVTMETYDSGGNLNTETSIYETIDEQYNRLNKAVYLKFTTTDITTTDFESYYNDPDLMNCNLWQPIIDQKTGFVSFTVTDADGDQLTMPEDVELFKQCCSAKGFEFGCFVHSTIDNKLIPVSCDESSVLYKIVKKCVDPIFIKCDKITDVKMVFPTNEWSGFLLPKEVDGKCELDISADIIIKYDADDLLNCAGENNCGFKLNLYDNSLYELDCMNWATFTNFESVVDTLRINTQSVDFNQIIDWQSINTDYVFLGDINTSQYVTYFDENNIQVWQTPGLQTEPNPQCCEASGGILVPKEEWATTHLSDRDEIINTFNSIKVGDIEPNNKLILESISEFSTLDTQLTDYINGITCIDIPDFTLKERPSKGFDYTNLITTKNVCNLGIPLDCGLYTHLLEWYWSRFNRIELAKDAIVDCIAKREFILSQITIVIEEEKLKKVEIQTTTTNCETTISGYETQLSECNTTIASINTQIHDLQSNDISTLTNDELYTLEQCCNTDKKTAGGSGVCDSRELQIYLDAHPSKIITDYEVKNASTQQQINSLTITLTEQQEICASISDSLNTATSECDTSISTLNQELLNLQTQLTTLNNDVTEFNCCSEDIIGRIETLNTIFVENRQKVIGLAQECYDEHNTQREIQYNLFLEDQVHQVLNYIDELEVCLTLEVDNNLGNSVDLNKRYTTLDAYTTKVWEFDPHSDYTGIIIEGEQTLVDVVKQSMFVKMRQRYGASSVTENTFEANWQHVSLPLTDEQITQLKTLYPNKPFFIGVAIKNFECDVCVLIDNIRINIETDEIERKFSFENCPSFDLRCVIDDKKSWVFSDGGVTETYDIPGINSCNIDPLADNNKRIVKFTQPQERSWLDVEYRHTDYQVNHELLVLNSKEASFRIDAAKAIECDVYNFWQQIDCSSSACTAETKSDCIITGYTNVCDCSGVTTGQCVTIQRYIEINPIDFLDEDPADVNSKPKMDKMVVSNLIDARNRQTLGGYPLLSAFYELYIDASNCGEEFSGKYDYSNLFEFTDLIGDYWLDLLEQVIPATTVMDGCQNSGKVYRNNIFDQPKFNYKKYSLNYFNEVTGGTTNGTHCSLEEITDKSIAEQLLCIEVVEATIQGDTQSESEACTNELNNLIAQAEGIKLLLAAVFGGSSSTTDQFQELIDAKRQECEDIKNAEKVIGSFTPLTERNKVFITQIYDTNEYEGDITVIGDPEWDKQDELIRVCGEN